MLGEKALLCTLPFGLSPQLAASLVELKHADGSSSILPFPSLPPALHLTRPHVLPVAIWVGCPWEKGGVKAGHHSCTRSGLLVAQFNSTGL